LWNQGDHSAVAAAQDGGELIAARWRGPADEESTELVWRKIINVSHLGDHI